MRRCVLLAGMFMVLALGVPATPAAQTPPRTDLSEFFGDLDGTFVLLDGATGEYVRHNPERAARRFAPCSTFKIPHTAILLESGTAPDPTFTLTYDPALKQPNNWARDFDLQGAFRASAMWYYRAMARRLGMDGEKQFVERLQYGNRDASGGLDSQQGPFWIDGSLRISPDEQVRFLKRFYERQIGFSERTTRLTKSIMVAEENPAWRLSAKTGACQPSGEDTSNWYVGYVERANRVYYFALQIGAPDFGRAFSERVPIARAILTRLRVLE